MQGMLLETEYFDSPMVTGRVLDWTLRPRGDRETAIFFIHGGGWRGGSRLGYHRLMEWFGQRGFWTASTDYRLSGVRLGDQIRDVRRGYHLFRQKLKQHNGPKSVLVFGSSAGAHLSLMLSLSKPGECGEPVDPEVREAWEKPAAVIVQAATVRFEEWPDMFPAILSNMQSIVGVPYQGNEAEWQRFAPIRYLSPESPPTLFLEAGNEHMFPHEYVLEFVERSNQIGVPSSFHRYPNAEHGFLYDHVRPVQQRALADCLNYIDNLPH